jgi:hypothetical protein
MVRRAIDGGNNANWLKKGKPCDQGCGEPKLVTNYKFEPSLKDLYLGAKTKSEAEPTNTAEAVGVGKQVKIDQSS